MGSCTTPPPLLGPYPNKFKKAVGGWLVDQGLECRAPNESVHGSHCGRLRLCRLCCQNPRLPLSQRAAQALPSLSSPALASRYHRGRLRLCRLCRRHYLPLSLWEFAQRTAENLVGLTPNLIIYRHKISWVHLSTGVNDIHKMKSCRQPQGPETEILDKELMNIKFELESKLQYPP